MCLPVALTRRGHTHREEAAAAEAECAAEAARRREVAAEEREFRQAERAYYLRAGERLRKQAPYIVSGLAPGATVSSQAPSSKAQAGC